MVEGMAVRCRILIAASLLVAALAASVYALYWFHVAGELRKGIDAFAQQRRTEGWIVELDDVRVDGFPGAVTARLGPLRLKNPAGLAWRTDGLAIRLHPLHPLDVTLDLAGQHLLSAPQLLGGDARAIVTAASAEVALRLTLDGEVGSVALSAAGLALETAGRDPLTAETLSFTLDRLNPTIVSHDQPSAAFTFAVAGLMLPELGGPLERRVRAVQIEGRVMGTPPVGGPVLAALAAWSRDGGTVELDRIAVDWPPLAIDGDGTVALDPALQPLVATTAHVRGWGEFMVRMVQAGMIEPGMAAAAQTVLTILARPDGQGRSTLTLPVTLQDGQVSGGQIRLMRLPPLPIAPP